ncbi:hypothetical protein QFZ25_001829 [Bacillus atrophaeus]|nr:hypothetical protein [Bacillus atrophaeus]
MKRIFRLNCHLLKNEELTSKGGDNLPKFWSYPLGLKVKINESTRLTCPHHVGRKGKIIELLHSATYDYAVSDETGDITFFKEHELNPIKGDELYA